jgi:hypothetical protein
MVSGKLIKRFSTVGTAVKKSPIKFEAVQQTELYMEQWFEIFKSGTHTDAAGNEREWTEADLLQIANNYNDGGHEAPLVIGHPKDNDPAYGWVEQLKAEGGVLLAKAKDVAQEFADAVKQGLYKKRSISLYPDLTLRHVGFLGAVPPAVKGLKDLQFEDAEVPMNYEFEETIPPASGHPLSPTGDKNAEGSESTNERLAALELELAATKAALQKTTLDFAETQAAREAAEQNLQKLYLQERLTSLKIYINEKLSWGSLTPAQAEKALQTLTVLETIEFTEKQKNPEYVFEFAEPNDKGAGSVKFSPVQVFKEFVDLLPKQFTEAPKGEAKLDLTDPNKIAEAALLFMEERKRNGLSISLSQAVTEISNNNQ